MFLLVRGSGASGISKLSNKWPVLVGASVGCDPHHHLIVAGITENRVIDLVRHDIQRSRCAVFLVLIHKILKKWSKNWSNFLCYTFSIRFVNVQLTPSVLASQHKHPTVTLKAVENAVPAVDAVRYGSFEVAGMVDCEMLQNFAVAYGSSLEYAPLKVCLRVIAIVATIFFGRGKFAYFLVLRSILLDMVRFLALVVRKFPVKRQLTTLVSYSWRGN